MFESEREGRINGLYTYKEAFSLWQEIGTCPNIGV